MPPPTFFARVAYTPRVASPVAVTVNGSRPGPLTVVVPATGTSSGVPSALTVPWSAPGSRPTDAGRGDVARRADDLALGGPGGQLRLVRYDGGRGRGAGHGQPGAGRDDHQHQQDGRDPAALRRAAVEG
jgi:hypothetical protein